MDSKVASTREFITAIQLDTKLDGLPASFLTGALSQARDARLHILDVINSAIVTTVDMSQFALRVIVEKVYLDKLCVCYDPIGQHVYTLLLDDDTIIHHF